MKTKILIIEDHDGFRQIVRRYLEEQDWAIEILEAATGEEGLDKAKEEKPAIILMDIQLPKMSGLDTARHIKKVHPECHIIALTMFDTDFLKMSFNGNFEDYISKSEVYERLIPLIHSTLNGNGPKPVQKGEPYA